MKKHLLLEFANAAAGREDAPYQWYNAKEVTDAVLKEAAPLNLEQIPAEREYVESHTFRYRSDVGRFMFVQIEKNLRSFGGYLSPRTERFICDGSIRRMGSLPVAGALATPSSAARCARIVTRVRGGT